MKYHEGWRRHRTARPSATAISFVMQTTPTMVRMLGRALSFCIGKMVSLAADSLDLTAFPTYFPKDISEDHYLRNETRSYLYLSIPSCNLFYFANSYLYNLVHELTSSNAWCLALYRLGHH
ncbi:hypothetical protein L208DRAFT_1406061 [Tricholoma matsutake]|nr:hypothetical protein L208DRAFT_1406061 [Tricholoma matsutake 945]